MLLLTLLLPIPVALSSQPAPASPSKEEKSEKEEPKWDISAAHGPVHTARIDVTEGTWMSLSAHDDTLVFDLLGDLWTLPLSGGEARRLSSGPAWDSEPRWSPDGQWIAFVSDRGGNEQLWRMKADGSEATQVTHEEEARVTDPVWDPAGDYLIGRRRTVDTRSIGVTELWQYHLDGGKGFALTSLDEHPHAGEVTTDGRYLWYSDRHGRFEYGGNPVAGLWDVWRLDRQTGQDLPVISGAGSAFRPTRSPDGSRFAFVSRDRTKTLLELFDPATGRRTVLADWLSHDQAEGFALHGVYPSMAWVDGGQAIALWAGGKLWKVGLDGKRTEIPFHAAGDWTFHDVPRPVLSTADTVQSKVIRWPVWNQKGALAFSSFGQLWVREPGGAVSRLSPGTGYSPAWSPDGSALAWTSWSDCAGEGRPCGGALHITRGKKTETLPLQGQLVAPAWNEDGTELVVLRGVGGGTSPDLGAEPWFELVHLKKEKKGWTSRVVTSMVNRGSASRAPHLVLRDGRVWFLEDMPVEGRKPAEAGLSSVALDGKDKRTHLIFSAATELVPSPDWRRVAYKEGHQVRVTALPTGPAPVRVGDGALPSRVYTDVVGDWLSWTPDGRALSWISGATVYRLPIPDLKEPADPKVLPKAEALTLDVSLPRARPAGVTALTHARVISMKGDEVIEDATIVVKGDRIESVVKGGPAPAGATVIDGTGKTVIPGLIDVHAHLHYTAGDIFPEQEWRYLTALDFGVTTVHDPSASTDLVFTQAERVAAGLERGPRVYSTGYILYGALDGQGAPTPDREAALHAVQRQKISGARSVKVYQQSRRDQRQWYIEACVKEGMVCAAEGGGDLFMNLNMVADGMTAIEHALPVAPLYADVRAFMTASRSPATGALGSAYTPTLLVAYGGAEGEHYFYQHGNPLNDARLLRHHPRRELDARTWRLPTFNQDDDWNFQEVARQAAKMKRDGLLVTLGAHGQLQGLGAHWELWALAGPGAMTPLEALRSATLDGARYLGLDAELGSIEAGKFADFIVLNANPLDDIHNSTNIELVVKNGEAWR